ncbi:sialate O-acetylesterase, partial [Klebsiella michiganensis]|uniref:sialate O-acetylesterase n=1 Tax=Klebsiella michiganensis TaxID=1134687 RepID=UPI002FF29240
SGISRYDGDDSIYPIVADSDGKVILGYDESTDKMFGPGIITDEDLSEIQKTSPSNKELSLSGISRYDSDDASIYPIVVDDDGKIVLGYNNNEDSLFGVGIVVEKDISSNKELSESGISRYDGDDSIYPIVADSDGKVILGYDESTDKMFGLLSTDIGANYAYEDSDFSLEMRFAKLNYFLTYGQSLSVGDKGTPVISAVQPFNNVTFAGGVRGGNSGTYDYSALVPLIEAGSVPNPSFGETPCSGAANYATLLAAEENGVAPNEHVILSSAPGRAGARINQISKGTPWYTGHLIEHFNRAKALEPDLNVQAVMWLQGESDSGASGQPLLNKEQYLAAFMALVSDINTDARAITGQDTPVIFLSYQHSTYVTQSSAATQLAMLDAQKQSDLVYVITPTYHLPHVTDRLHLSAVGYKWIGAYFGRAYKQIMHDRIKPRAIQPVSSIHRGDTIRVRFKVPVSPLVLDNVSIPATKDYGFLVTSDGNTATILKINVENGNTIVIKTASVLYGNVVVRYALDYNGANLASGASGNLRDSCPDTVVIDGSERTMYYVSPHFQLTSVKGEI